MVRYIAPLLFAHHTKMAPGFLSSDGGNEILGMDRRLVGVVALIAIVVVGGVAAMWILSDDSADVNAQLDVVPDGADGVIYVDGTVMQDELMLETLDGGIEVGWWFLDSGAAPSIDVVLETLDTENIDYNQTTAFLQTPEDDQADYAGAYLELGPESASSDLVTLVEDEVGELDQDEYNGVDVYEVDIVDAAEDVTLEGVTDELDITALITEFIGEDTTAWIATPDDNTVILGSDDAVADAIDVYQGDSDPFEGDVRNSHEELTAAPVELTADVDLIDEPLPEVASVVSADVATALSLTGGNPEYISAGYDVRDRNNRTMTLEAIISMERQSGADDLFTLFESYVDVEEVLDDPESIANEDVPDRAGGAQNGRYIQFEVPIFPEQMVGYVADFVDEFGPSPQPYEMMPDEATSIVELNGTLFTEGVVHDETVAEAIDAGVFDGENSPSAEVVLERAQANELNFTSATTFYGDDDEYVGTFVKLDGPAEDIIENEIRQELLDVESEGYDHREDEDGYRHTDVYELPELDEELALTRYLSGFQADGQTEWLVPISNDSMLLGTESAVTDAVDILRGVTAPGETQVHETYNQTDGLITATGDVTDKPVDAYAGTVDTELETALANQPIDVLSVGYDLRTDSAVTLGAAFVTADEAAGDDLASALGDVVSPTADDQALDAPLHERAGLSQDGQSVMLDIPYRPTDLVGDMGAFIDEFGTEPFPTA